MQRIKDNNFELNHWGDCCDTFIEESKQIKYAEMLSESETFLFHQSARSVIDIGGGPVSMLLKRKNFLPSVVVDPLSYPKWTRDRYDSKAIEVWQVRGEDIDKIPDIRKFDEVWIYNCLQHTDNPEKIIQNAKQKARVLRIWEWINQPARLGHPQELKSDLLEKWIGQHGKVRSINSRFLRGEFFYGVFDLTT